MYPSTSESDERFEVCFEFFVSGGESAEVFEFGEASFDSIAQFVQCFVVLTFLFAIALGRDDSGRPHGLDVGEDGLAVVALICQYRLGLSLSEQFDGLGAIMHLSWGHEEVHRQAKLIGKQVDLGRQTSSGTPQSLVLAPFLRPVAAC